MKATAETITAVSAPDKSRAALWADLFKARLTSLVLLTTLAGFYMGTRGATDFALLAHTLIATALLAAGAAALNQVLEWEDDAKMRRTRQRPIPSKRMQPETALIVGGIISAAGLIYLALGVNLLTSVLGALTLASYLFVYTPLKRRTPLNTVVGAIPGALPPLMGWTAARGTISVEGWSLFAILFFWQLPHFLAIAWIYKDEYAQAGFAMLPVVDPQGQRTGRQSVSHTLGLCCMSLFPFVFHLAGTVYLAGAVVLGSLFLWAAVTFSRRLGINDARRLFLVSILYLPLLLGTMVLDKIRF